MHDMIGGLAPLLDKTGFVGYAAAYNRRMLSNQVFEYVNARDEAIKRYGEPGLDGDGKPTGGYRLLPGTPGYDSFMAEMGPLMGVKHSVELVTVTAREAIDSGITGQQMLDADFMFDWSTRDGEEVE